MKDCIAQSWSRFRKGDHGEQVVFDALLELGLPANLSYRNAPYDIGIGGMRVDVKSCYSVFNINYPRPSAPFRPAAHFSTASQRSKTGGGLKPKNYERDCDFLICRWMGNEQYAPRTWVIPVADIKTATIVPFDDESRWDQFENRFDLIVNSLLIRDGPRKPGEYARKATQPGGRAAFYSNNRPPALPKEEQRKNMQDNMHRTNAARRMKTVGAIQAAAERLAARGMPSPNNVQLAREAGVVTKTVMRYRQRLKTLN